MAINWKAVVAANAPEIVNAARGTIEKADAVCALLDIDDARAGKVSPGFQQLIATTKLARAILVSVAEGNRLVCIPVTLSTIVAALEPHEETAELTKRIRTGGSLVLWVVCFDGEQRTCLDIHVRTPEFN